MKAIHLILILLCVELYAQNELTLLTTVHGEKDGDAFSKVAVLGDINGDGYDDFIVGSQEQWYSKLYFGGNPFDTLNCIRFQTREPFTSYNASFAGNGDLNGDGYKDFGMGAYYDMFQFGKIFIHFGGVSIDTVADLTITGKGYYYHFGSRMAMNGDLNGDGYDDLVVSAPMDDYDARGRVYIYFGGKEMDTDCDVFLEGKEPFDMFGESVSIIGDANGDGYDDLLVSTPQDLKGKGGKVYLFWGGDSLGFNHAVEFVGDTLPYNSYGRVVSGVGDVNGDGFDDFGILSISYIDVFSGKTLKILSKINSFYEFWKINGLDLNKDGYSDIIVSYAERENQYAGGVALYLGGNELDTVAVLTLNGKTKNSYFGSQVTVGGDINKDGLPEIFIGEEGELTQNGTIGIGTVFIYSYGKLNGIEDPRGAILPEDYKLYQNYPNPFNPTTTISYSLPEAGNVQIKVYDVLGREVAKLVDEIKSAGKHTVAWNGSNNASGIYFYTITFNNRTLYKKMLMIK